LPEDLADRAKSLDDRIFRELSGRSELVKVIYAKVLQPYSERRLVAFASLVRGRSHRDERDRLRRRIDRMLAGRRRAKVEGIDPLIQLVVERRSIPIQRLAHHLLRSWLPVHVAASALLLVLLVCHALSSLGYR